MEIGSLSDNYNWIQIKMKVSRFGSQTNLKKLNVQHYFSIQLVLYETTWMSSLFFLSFSMPTWLVQNIVFCQQIVCNMPNWLLQCEMCNYSNSWAIGHNHCTIAACHELQYEASRATSCKHNTIVACLEWCSMPCCGLFWTVKSLYSLYINLIDWQSSIMLNTNWALWCMLPLRLKVSIILLTS